MDGTRVEDLGEKDDDGELGHREGENSRNEGYDSIVDRLANFRRVDVRDVPACAVGDCHAGQGDINDAEDL